MHDRVTHGKSREATPAWACLLCRRQRKGRHVLPRTRQSFHFVEDFSASDWAKATVESGHQNNGQQKTMGFQFHVHSPLSFFTFFGLSLAYSGASNRSNGRLLHLYTAIVNYKL